MNGPVRVSHCGSHVLVMLNSFQHLFVTLAKETLKQVQGDIYPDLLRRHPVLLYIVGVARREPAVSGLLQPIPDPKCQTPVNPFISLPPSVFAKAMT